MDITTYLAIWRRRWLLVLAATLLGLVGAVAVSATTQPQYVASARMFVTTTGGASVVEAYQGNLFGQERVLSYAQLAMSRQVAQRTIDAMGLDMTPGQLMPMIAAERVPLETVLLDISVTNPNPDLARDIANAVAQQTSQLVEELETSARGGTPAATATLVDVAETPSSPAVPNWFRNILIGLLGGLILGLVAAIARDRLDRSVRTDGDAADAAGARPLGTIPPLPDKGSGVPFGPSRPQSSEAFRSLRATLLGKDGSPPSEVVVLAEPKNSADAAAVALGLGAAVAEVGRSVLVMDADLRSKAVSARLGLESAPGLTNVLSGTGFLDETLAEIGVERLKVLPAGTAEGDAGAFLARPGAADLIKQLRTEFDVVLISGSGISPYSDTVSIANSADGLLLVVRAKATTSPEVMSAAERVRATYAEPLGVVVTNGK